MKLLKLCFIGSTYRIETWVDGVPVNTIRKNDRVQALLIFYSAVDKLKRRKQLDSWTIQNLLTQTCKPQLEVCLVVAIPSYNPA